MCAFSGARPEPSALIGRLSLWQSTRETCERGPQRRTATAHRSGNRAAASERHASRGRGYQALRTFGGVDQIKETCRDARGTATLDALVRDTRHGVRRLVRDWRFTTAAVLILGLGIGANTATFSLINATLFRGQSLVDPDRLVDIYQNVVNPGGVDANSYQAYQDMAAYTDVFASTTAVSLPLSLNYLDEGGLRLRLPSAGQRLSQKHLAEDPVCMTLDHLMDGVVRRPLAVALTTARRTIL
jgi:hypothetical protein